MKKRSRIFLITISSLLLILCPQVSTWSCGPFLDPEATVFQLFQQDLPGDPALEAFYYTERFLNYSSNTGDGDYNTNCLEWQAFAGAGVKLKDIYTIQYDLKGNDFLQARNTGDWSKLDGNTFIQWLRTNKTALNYFTYAKNIEALQMESNFEWGVPNAFHSYDSLIQTGLQKCQKDLPEFLRQRYAFQVVKLMYYRELYAYRDTDISIAPLHELTSLIKCYETYLKGKNTIVADWGMLYYAFSFKDPGKRALYLLKTFDRCDSKNIVVYNHLSKGDLDSVKTDGLTNKTKAAIYAYQAIKNPGRALPELKKSLDADPNSRYVRLLVSREINKIEEWILEPQVQGFNGRLSVYLNDSLATQDSSDEYYARKNLQKDMAYAGEVRRYLEGLMGRDLDNRNFLKLSIVHLLHMEHEFAAAGRMLDEMKPFKNQKLEKQRLIEQAISLMNLGDVEDAATQAALEKQFAALEKTGFADMNNSARDYENSGPYRFPLNEVYLLLSKRFEEKGDIVKAGLFAKKSALVLNEYSGSGTKFSESGNDDYYDNIDYFDKRANPADIDALTSFLNKKSPTAFEKRIMPRHAFNGNALCELKGTLYLRQGNFEKALETWKPLADDYWQNNYEFKEYLRKSNISSVGTLLPVKNGNPQRYPIASKKAIVGDIVALRKALAAANDADSRARLCFLLGNCYYNISYYGKDWMVYSYGKSASIYSSSWHWDFFSFYPSIAKHEYAFYECGWAREMYKQAIAHSGKNKELAAQATLMLSLCDEGKHASAQNKWTFGYGKYREYKDYYYHSPYLAKLKKDYSRTTTCIRAKTECPDIEEYFKSL